MPIISIIVAVDKKFGIGKNNQLLCHLPRDLKFFKDTTMGKPIIMGRKTYESIGRPLPGRKNIVISHQALEIPGVIVFHDLETAIKSLDETEIFIIGGASLYQQSMDLIDKIYLTQIEYTFDADVFFPEITLNQWKLIQEEYHSEDDKNAYALTFKEFSRIH